MKYIRTKQGKIDEVIGETELHWIVKDIPEVKGALLHKSFVVQQASTIEDLCDEFIFDDGYGTPLLCTYKELTYWFNYSKKQQYKTRNCYGAIWTAKGLVYVAKLNDKRELELI